MSAMSEPPGAAVSGLRSEATREDSALRHPVVSEQ
jgi:hypothetical protein